MKSMFSPARRGRFLTRLTLAASLVLLTAPIARAGTVTGTVASSVILGNDCQLASGGLAFGSTSSLTTSVQTQTKLQIVCTPGTAYTVGISIGTTPGSKTTNGIPSRYMMDAANDLLPYYLYQDSARTQIFGLGSYTEAGTGTGGTQFVTIYGTYVNTSKLPAGDYSDTVTVSLSY